MTKHNVQKDSVIVYDEAVTSNTYVDGNYFDIGTINQLQVNIICAIAAPATQVLIKVGYTDNIFDYDFAPPDMINATVVGDENQIPMNTHVFVVSNTSQVVSFFLPVSGTKMRFSAKTNNAAGSANVVIRVVQVIV